MADPLGEAPRGEASYHRHNCSTALPPLPSSTRRLPRLHARHRPSMMPPLLLALVKCQCNASLPDFLHADIAIASPQTPPLLAAPPPPSFLTPPPCTSIRPPQPALPCLHPLSLSLQAPRWPPQSALSLSFPHSKLSALHFPCYSLPLSCYLSHCLLSSSLLSLSFSPSHYLSPSLPLQNPMPVSPGLSPPSLLSPLSLSLSLSKLPAPNPSAGLPSLSHCKTATPAPPCRRSLPLPRVISLPVSPSWPCLVHEPDPNTPPSPTTPAMLGPA